MKVQWGYSGGTAQVQEPVGRQWGYRQDTVAITPRMRTNASEVIKFQNYRLATSVESILTEVIASPSNKNERFPLVTNDSILLSSSHLVMFHHPFSMLVSGPSGSGKSERTRKFPFTIFNAIHV